MKAALALGVLALCVGFGAASLGQDVTSGPGVTSSQLNTAVQATLLTTGAGGGWSVTWAQRFAGTPVVNAIPINSSAQPEICNPSSVTAAGASGTCWSTASTGLTLAIVTSGITVNPTTTVPNGTSVEVIGRSATQ